MFPLSSSAQTNLGSNTKLGLGKIEAHAKED